MSPAKRPVTRGRAASPDQPTFPIQGAAASDQRSSQPDASRSWMIRVMAARMTTKTTRVSPRSTKDCRKTAQKAGASPATPTGSGAAGPPAGAGSMRARRARKGAVAAARIPMTSRERAWRSRWRRPGERRTPPWARRGRTGGRGRQAGPRWAHAQLEAMVPMAAYKPAKRPTRSAMAARGPIPTHSNGAASHGPGDLDPAQGFQDRDQKRDRDHHPQKHHQGAGELLQPGLQKGLERSRSSTHAPQKNGG